MRVLLVEDHPIVAEVSCNVLREVHDHMVEHASNGKDALAMAERFQPEIILIDVNLPDMDGYQLAAQLRAQPQFDETVLIALTGIGHWNNPKRAADSGIDAHFTKPMDFGLLETLKRK
jgi:CheY-like chemotaxis protein